MHRLTGPSGRLDVAELTIGPEPARLGRHRLDVVVRADREQAAVCGALDGLLRNLPPSENLVRDAFLNTPAVLPARLEAELAPRLWLSLEIGLCALRRLPTDPWSRFWLEIVLPIGFRGRLQHASLLGLAENNGVRASSDVALTQDRLLAAIALHHAQKADDRCVEDDDRLYAAAGLPPCDRRVGDKAAMLANCQRFIERRCEGGGWPSYAELEAERDRLAVEVERLRQKEPTP